MNTYMNNMPVKIAVIQKRKSNTSQRNSILAD